MKRDRQKYKGHQVVKIDDQGNTVATYDSMHLAQIEEKVSYVDLKAALDKGKLLKGYRFVYGSKNMAYGKRTSSKNSTPWEQQGFFNIDGWAKAAF